MVSVSYFTGPVFLPRRFFLSSPTECRVLYIFPYLSYSIHLSMPFWFPFVSRVLGRTWVPPVSILRTHPPGRSTTGFPVSVKNRTNVLGVISGFSQSREFLRPTTSCSLLGGDQSSKVINCDIIRLKVNNSYSRNKRRSLKNHFYSD